MKKQKSQVGISQKNTIANAQEAKLIARQIVAKMTVFAEWDDNWYV